MIGIDIIKLQERYNSPEFAGSYDYDGALGCFYTPSSASFRLWAPIADSVLLCLYNDDTTPCFVMGMERAEKGTWFVSLAGDFEGLFYTYRVTVNGVEREVVDPYAKAVGVNGVRAQVVELSRTNPEGWESDRRPEYGDSPTDAVVYELHIRDLSSDEHSGIQNKGKYKGLTEHGTKTPGGTATGLDHIVSMGVTHVQLLPCFDYGKGDERCPESWYNWGYDPLNYFVPEGSYATDPYDGSVRIREFKAMVKALHDAGLCVVMDMVYNHTADTENLNNIVPYYYYRCGPDGELSNGSGCGNETASERSMVRKLIVDSVLYWAREYHIDGFRFDLMALHDIETMNMIREALDDIDPGILLYGEGWTGGESPLPESRRASKGNAGRLKGRIGIFNDEIRDAVMGGVFNASEPGCAAGELTRLTQLHSGITASASPGRMVTYISCHDNMTVWDKLKASIGAGSIDRAYRLAAAILLTSQGQVFIHAGEEMARTKGGNANSYNAGDEVNHIDWQRLEEHATLCGYYRGLIALRKMYPSFRLHSAGQLAQTLSFRDTETGIVAYTLSGTPGLLVAFNLTAEKTPLALPGAWELLADGDRAGTEPLRLVEQEILLPPHSAAVLRKI